MSSIFILRVITRLIKFFYLGRRVLLAYLIIVEEFSIDSLDISLKVILLVFIALDTFILIKSFEDILNPFKCTYANMYKILYYSYTNVKLF